MHFETGPNFFSDLNYIHSAFVFFKPDFFLYVCRMCLKCVNIMIFVVVTKTRLSSSFFSKFFKIKIIQLTKIYFSDPIILQH